VVPSAIPRAASPGAAPWPRQRGRHGALAGLPAPGSRKRTAGRSSRGTISDNFRLRPRASGWATPHQLTRRLARNIDDKDLRDISGGFDPSKDFTDKNTGGASPGVKNKAVPDTPPGGGGSSQGPGGGSSSYGDEDADQDFNP
jgi:hypothetical protein